MSETKVATKHFTIEGSDETSKSASPGATGLLFKFADGNELAVNMDEFPEDIRRAFESHGAGMKISNSYAGSKEKGGTNPVTWAYDEADTMIDNLKNGVWSDRAGGGGARLTILHEAIIRIAIEGGHEVNDEAAVALKVKLVAEAVREAAMENPDVVLMYSVIQGERAVAKAEKLKAAIPTDDDAVEATDTLLDDLFGV